MLAVLNEEILQVSTLDSHLSSIFDNIVASFIYTLLAVGFGVLLFRFRNNQLYRFFGISEDKRFIIYLSHLHILNGNARGYDGEPRSFQGSTITVWEQEAAQELARVFHYLIPEAQSLPAILNTITLSDVRTDITASPIDMRSIDRSCSFIAVGGPGYNLVSRVIQNDRWPGYGFLEENNATVIRLPDIPDVYPSALGRGFLARIRFGQGWWFYAAGFNEQGTRAAVHYLTHHWSTLLDTHQEDSFYVLLEVQSGDSRFPIVLENRRFDSQR